MKSLWHHHIPDDVNSSALIEALLNWSGSTLTRYIICPLNIHKKRRHLSACKISGLDINTLCLLAFQDYLCSVLWMVYSLNIKTVPLCLIKPGFTHNKYYLLDAVSWIVAFANSRDSVHKSHFLKKKMSRSGESNLRPSAYQPSVLPRLVLHVFLLSTLTWIVCIVNMTCQ